MNICERIYPQVQVSLKCSWLQKRLKHVIRKNRKLEQRKSSKSKKQDTNIVVPQPIILPSPKPPTICPSPKPPTICPSPKPPTICPKCQTCPSCPICPVCPKTKKCLAYYENYENENDRFRHHPSLICDSFFGLFNREVEIIFRQAALESFTYNNLCTTLSKSFYQEKMKELKRKEKEREIVADRIERNRFARVREYERRIKTSQLNRENCKRKYPETIHSCAHICFNNREKICF